MVAMSSSFMAFQVNCSLRGQRPSLPNNYDHFKIAFSSSIKENVLSRALKGVEDDFFKTINNAKAKVLDAFVDSVFQFVDQPLLPSQSNFAPVDELSGGPVVINTIHGSFPDNFPDGVYIRNGANPLFGGLKSTQSMFGKTNHIWIEGEGMLHALYFSKDLNSKRTVHYYNRYVETDTSKQEKQRNKPSFIPIIKGDLIAVVFAVLFNMLRFGTIDKQVSNTNVFEHSGKLYSIAECHLPHEIDVSTLQTLGNWDLSQAWNRPFTSHPKRAPGSGELVIIGVNAVTRPYMEMGVISADGKRIVHRADLKLDRCTFCHDFGVTERYNVVMDFPITIDILRFFQGGPLIKYNKEGYARIGVMPRYGNADSIKWFEVESNCTFHIINCFEDGDEEVVVRGCRARDSVLPFDEPSDDGSSVLVSPYEWRLNTRTGGVRETSLIDDKEISMEVPIINENFTGLKNRFGYTQVIKSNPNCTGDDIPKFGGLAKLHFENIDKIPASTKRVSGEEIKVEYRMFEDNTFCSGATFVPKLGGLEEDDGWIITFLHNEDTDISQALVIDAKKFSGEPVANITLPYRVPYGFHGAFIPFSSQLP